MKAIITGDWHIKIRGDVPEEWQISRYEQLFSTIIDLCKQHKANLWLAGDILDRNRPSLQEMMLLLNLLSKLEDEKIITSIICGNHENIGEGRSTYSYLSPILSKKKYIFFQEPGSIFGSSDMEGEEFTVEVQMIGHTDLKNPPPMKPETTDSTKVLITHVRPNVNQFIKEEIDVAKLIEPYDYIFAGDIHMPVEIEYGDKQVVYTNHPLNSCFEEKPEGGVILLETSGKEVNWKRIKLELPNLRLIRTTPALLDKVLPKDSKDFYKIEVSGPAEELRTLTCSLPNVKLERIPEVADTYVVTEEEEADSKQPTVLADALIEYMQELTYSEEKIQKMMEVYYES